MDREKLEKDIKEIELKLAEMKKELETKEGKPFPQKGDKYYYINTEGEINSSTASDSEGRFQAFRTKEEAQKFYNVECARKRVKDEIKRLNNGWTPDWNKAEQPKSYISFFYKKSALEKNRAYSTKVIDDSMYLKNEDLVEELISTHKLDLLLILGQ